MRLASRVALVASGANGMGLTSPWDCNVYLVDGGEESALIDAGCGLEPERILDRISRSGLDAGSISRVLLTHCHADHSAGAAFWSDRLGTDVVAPGLSAAALRAGDEDTIGLERARAAGGYPPDYVLSPVPVDGSVDEGDVVRVGEVRLEVLATPGHSFDHVSYLLRCEEGPLLFGGDVLLTDGRIMLLDTPDCQIHAYGETIRRLAGMQIEGLMPGHGAFNLTGAREIFTEAASYFERLVVPPSFS